jgi:hypothetical protein
MREYFKTLVDHMAQRITRLAINRALEMCEEVERDAEMAMRKMPDVIEHRPLRQLELWSKH